MNSENEEQAILAQERRALDRWAQGNPLGYVETDADDITYFDDIGAQARIDGLEAVRNYFAGLMGKVPEHRYEVVNPKVQVYGEIGIVTLRYQPFGTDGGPMTPWKATSVYRRTAETWRKVHAHWSIAKDS